MRNACSTCKHGHERRPDRQALSPGTVWCGLRKLQMAKQRELSCFVPLVVIKIKACVDCKKAKMLKPSGETPQLGNVWCIKKHIEINKQRSMDCFE